MGRALTGYSRRLKAQNTPWNCRSATYSRGLKVLLCAIALAFGASAGRAQRPEKTLYLPDSLSGVIYPSCITYSPAGNKFYVSGGISSLPPPRVGSDCWVVVIDAATGHRVKRIAVPTEISALCYNATNNQVYAVNYVDSVLSVINCVSDSVVAEVRLPCDPNFGMCWNSALNKIYLELNTDSALAVIDGAADTVIKTVQTVPRASLLVCAPNHNRVYCGGSILCEVAAVDCTADTVCARFALATPPSAICYDTAGDRVFVADESHVTCIDAASDSVVATATIAQWIIALGYSSLRNRLYCALGLDSVIVMDASTLAVVAQLHIEGTGAKSVWCDSRHDRAYCASNEANIVEVIDCATNSMIAVLPAGESPVALCPNAAEDKVYCVDYGSDDVTVISGDSVAARVAVGSRPGAFCFNPTRNKVYCADYSNGLVSVIDGATNQVLANVRVGYRVPDLCYAAEADKVYCPSIRDGSVSVIDCSTDSVIARLRDDTCPGLISYSSVRNRVYCSYNAWPDPKLFVIDCATDSVRSTIDLPDVPVSQCYDRLADKLYCGFSDVGEMPRCVRVVDCGPDSVVDTVPGTSSVCCDMFSSPLCNKVYCDLPYRGEFVIVDGAADTILRTIHWPGSVLDWSDACFSRKRLYLALEATPGLMWVMDPKTDSILDRVTSSPLNGVCYNATNDRVYASVGSVGTDSVNILDCASDQYVSQIPVGRWPTRLVWNDVSNKVYVANQLSGSISIIRDSGGGIEEAARHEEQPAKLATIVHGVMYLPKASGPDRVPQAVLLDISGRKVLALSPGRNSVRSLASGVYFLRFSDQSNVQKIVVSR